MNPHLIMPMGGAGSRFKKNGYEVPKPLIEINQRPFFYWAAMSIMKYIDIKDLTFVVLKDHVDKYEIDKRIKEYFPDAYVIIIPNVLPGPVFTAIEGTKIITDEEPIIFNDCDHMFRCDKLSKKMSLSKMDEEGVLLTFESSKPIYSYVDYSDGKVTGTVEKKVVSNRAICGAYVFKNKELFLMESEKYINNCPYNECFMSGIYNVLCDDNRLVRDYLLDYHVEFGTPEEYEEAQSSEYFQELM